MATDQGPPALPGDVVQDSTGHLYLAAEVFGWGVGAVQRWRAASGETEAYHRLKWGSFVVVGVAPLLPEEVAQARRDAAQTAALLASERGEPYLPDALAVIRHLMRGIEGGNPGGVGAAYGSAEAWLRERGL